MSAPLKVRLERELRQDDDVTGSTLLVGLVALTYADADGRGCRPGIERLAQCCGLSVDARGNCAPVSRALRRLRDLGYLETVRAGRNGRTTEYRWRSRLAPVVSLQGQTQHVPRDRLSMSPGTDSACLQGQTTNTRPTHLPTQAGAVVDAYGITPAAAAGLVEQVAADPETRTTALARLVKDGRPTSYGLDLVAALEANTQRLRALQVAEAREVEPDCEHGTPAGMYPNPVDGRPLCPLCRAAGLAPHTAEVQTANDEREVRRGNG